MNAQSTNINGILPSVINGAPSLLKGSFVGLVPAVFSPDLLTLTGYDVHGQYDAGTIVIPIRIAFTKKGILLGKKIEPTVTGPLYIIDPAGEGYEL
jgi:hypothetical protein